MNVLTLLKALWINPKLRKNTDLVCIKVVLCQAINLELSILLELIPKLVVVLMQTTLLKSAGLR